MNLLILTFIDLFVTAFNFLILIRVVMSWVSPGGAGGFRQTIINLTEPLLEPIRRLIPSGGMLDISSLVAFILLQVLQIGAHRLLG